MSAGSLDSIKDAGGVLDFFSSKSAESFQNMNDQNQTPYEPGENWVNDLLREYLVNEATDRAAAGSWATPTRPVDSYVSWTPAELDYFDQYGTLDPTQASKDYWDAGSMEAYHNLWNQAISPEVYGTWDATQGDVWGSLAAKGFEGAGIEQALTEAGTQFGADVGTTRGDFLTGAMEESLQTAAERAQTEEALRATEMDIAAQQGDLSAYIEEGRINDLLDRWYSGETVDGQYNPLYTDIFEAFTTATGQHPLEYDTLVTDTSYSGLGSAAGSYLSDLFSNWGRSGGDGTDINISQSGGGLYDTYLT